ncbi:cupin [Variovorax sp. RHLX14]|uniref:cupin n=1 Tax=Variovorax sp. RHLX14 TaxID=1259731 RepID=UPI003F47E4DC
MPKVLSKLHREFFAIHPECDSTAWSPVASSAGLIEEILLADNLDSTTRTGSRTRLARWSAGALIDRPVVHDFHEEVFIVEGDLAVGCDAEGGGGELFGPYTFACRPPGAVHGPFVSRTGCTMLEFQYYA